MAALKRISSCVVSEILAVALTFNGRHGICISYSSTGIQQSRVAFSKRMRTSGPNGFTPMPDAGLHVIQLQLSGNIRSGMITSGSLGINTGSVKPGTTQNGNDGGIKVSGKKATFVGHVGTSAQVPPG